MRKCIRHVNPNFKKTDIYTPKVHAYILQSAVAQFEELLLEYNFEKKKQE